jgi:hypothetical protein
VGLSSKIREPSGCKGTSTTREKENCMWNLKKLVIKFAGYCCPFPLLTQFHYIYLTYKIKTYKNMKKQFLVIYLNDVSFSYIVDSLDELIDQMYEVELMNGEPIETVHKWFNENYKVFQVNGEVIEL